jgi:hypothetical protein
MRTQRRGILVGAAVVLLAAGAARATSSSCVLDARDEAKDCRKQCATTFRDARDICRNVDPVCGNACRDARIACGEPFRVILDGCLDGCAEELKRDKAACPADGDPTRDACLDAAQVAAFVCRDTCRENQTVRDGLSACRQQFRDCLAACPPPAGG